MCLLALVIGVGCTGEPERTAPWREPGLLHDKPSWLPWGNKGNDVLKNSQPLPPETGTAATAETPAAAGTGAQQPLPSAGVW
jgi:hypothetical protein